MERLRRWLTEPAQPLAALRIAVALIILVSPELRNASELAGDPSALDRVPEGLGLVARIPIGPTAASFLEIVALSSGACALLGYYSRLSMGVLTLSAGLAFSLSQRSGAVIHDMHLFWFGSLLTLSPCGDAWSLDAWNRPVPSPSVDYGVPLAFARTLLGFVYFFPGVHKLAESGLAWLSAENVVRQMHMKWFEVERVPLLRIDGFPELCTMGAALVVTFELTWIALVQVRKTRLLAVGLGLSFHLGTQVFFFIPFPSLWLCYVACLPFGRRHAEPPPAPLRLGPASRRVALLGTLLAAVVSVQGARGKTQAWPFACYPTFANLVGEHIDDLAFEMTRADGTTVRFSGREKEPRTQFEWARVFYLTGATGEPPDRPALRAFAQRMARRSGVELDGARKLVAVRQRYRTAPEGWTTPDASFPIADLTPR